MPMEHSEKLNRNAADTQFDKKPIEPENPPKPKIDENPPRPKSGQQILND